MTEKALIPIERIEQAILLTETRRSQSAGSEKPLQIGIRSNVEHPTPNIQHRSLRTVLRRRFRGQKVMLDRDLATLYGVPVKALKQAVRRNAERFPEDFMFKLSKDEFEDWRSQIVTSKKGRGGRRTPPYAFTEQGVAMLSSVLRSPQAFEPLKIPTHSVFGAVFALVWLRRAKVSQACLSFPSGRPAAPPPGRGPAIESGRPPRLAPLRGARRTALQRALLNGGQADAKPLSTSLRKLMTPPAKPTLWAFLGERGLKNSTYLRPRRFEFSCNPRRKIGFGELREEAPLYQTYRPLSDGPANVPGKETP